MTKIDPKKFTMPLAAFTMAWGVFFYTRSSIHAARNETRKGPKDGAKYNTRTGRWE